MLTDGRTDDGRTDDGRRTPDAGVTGILIAHLGAFGSGELIIITKIAIYKNFGKQLYITLVKCDPFYELFLYSY